MKIKREKTEEEIAAHKAEIAFNRKYAGFKRSLKTLCKNGELRLVELELEFLKTHPNTELPKKAFNHAQTVEIYTDAIQEYKKELKTKNN